MSRSILELVRAEMRPLRAYAPPSVPPAIKLDANESPWPLPPEARARVAEVVAGVDLHRYPDPRATGLREALVKQVGGPPNALLLGAGSDECIALLMTALARPRGQRERAAVLFPEPTFVMFAITATAHGLEPVGVPLDPHWQLDVEAMRAAIETHQPNIVFLATPNNPTGGSFADEHLRTLIESDPEALFVIDEAYGAFARRSLSSWCDEYPNVATLGTLSKVGLAAARVGWCRLPAALSVEVDKARQPYNLSSLSQAVGALALGELAPILEAHVLKIVQERDRLGAALTQHERMEVFPSQANFLLCRHQGDVELLVRGLLDAGIAVKGYLSGRLAGHVRITVGTPDENDRLLEALHRLDHSAMNARCGPGSKR